jgi:hypothetical protein
MCFSAQASFAGGAIISSIGVANLSKVLNPSHRLFAGIPLLFGVQQIAEGFLWVTLPSSVNGNIQQLAAYIFLLIALVIWPVILPLSVFKMEEKGKRRKILKIFLGLGILLAAYYGYCMAVIGVRPEINCYHIIYKGDFPSVFIIPAFLLYVVVTVTPLFISSLKGCSFMGLLTLFSCAVSAVFFRLYLTSVWCFFAAILSGIIYYILREYEKNYSIRDSREIKIA